MDVEVLLDQRPGLGAQPQAQVVVGEKFLHGICQRSGIALECLRRRGDEKVSHDHYFHSVLGLMQVQTSVYDRARDAYAPCRTPL